MLNVFAVVEAFAVLGVVLSCVCSCVLDSVVVVVDSFVLLFVFEQATRVTATSIKLIMIVTSFLIFSLLNFIYDTHRVISTV